jgi:hypothetical protein
MSALLAIHAVAAGLISGLITAMASASGGILRRVKNYIKFQAEAETEGLACRD